MATVRSLVDEELKALASALQAHSAQLLEFQRYAASNLERPSLLHFPNATATDLPAWRALSELLLTKKGEWRRAVDKRAGFPADSAEQKQRKQAFLVFLDELRELPGIDDALSTLKHLPEMAEGEASWQLVINLFHVLPRLAAQLLLVFARLGQVDHGQVAMSALQALGEDDAPTDLALRLDYRIEHILVDEFQDTAISQYELVHRLTRGWGSHNASNPDAPRTVMIVGDGMQSIYGFRNANVGLFLKAREEGFNGVALEPLQLLCNFRSVEGIVSWVNSTFASAFPDADDMHRGQVRFTAAVPVKSAQDAPAVQCHGFDGEGWQQLEVKFICDRLQQGIEDSACQSIALLGRSRGQLQPFTRELRQRGVAFSAQDLETLGDSPAVLDLMTLCRALANPADRLAWLALVRAPWCGLLLADLHRAASFAGQGEQTAPRLNFSDPQLQTALSADGRDRLTHLLKVLEYTESRRDRLALRVWIEQAWLALGGPATVLHPSQFSDIERFFQLLETADRDGFGFDIGWLQRQVDNQKLGEEQPDSKLQVMTLHKAKGLEFDWVFIPGLSRLTRVGERPLLLWDESTTAEGERFLVAADDRSDPNEPTLYHYLREQRKRKDRLEQTRLLYVGATRAVRKLWLTAGVKAAEGEDAWKAPAAGSLLSPIWDAFHQQFVPHLSENVPTAEAATGMPLRRLKTLPVARLVATESAGETDANIPERALNRVERHTGTVVHLALEQLAQQEVLPDEIVDTDLAGWRMSLQALGLHGEDLERALSAVAHSVTASLADSRGRWILSTAHPDACCEYPLTLAVAPGRFQDLVIDRTFLDRDSGDRWIVDYKTSRPREGEAREVFLQRETVEYTEQLATYRQAMASGGSENIRCALYFTAISVFHEVELL